jgi:2-methylcitrate dehydratase
MLTSFLFLWNDFFKSAQGLHHNGMARFVATLFVYSTLKYHFMTHQIRQIAAFTLNKQFEDISKAHIDQLKRHLLDSIGSFIFSISEDVPQKVKKAIAGISGVSGSKFPLQLPANLAAQYYTSLIRFPDFMDNFLAKESTCHPSDNIGALLAVAHLGTISGKDFLTAMAISYEIECRLTEQMPIMVKGYDHTALLAFSATAGAGRLLKLSQNQMMSALGIAGCSFNPLVTSRASYTSQWKGLASSLVNEGCINICMLARENITGPRHLFEVPEKGYDAIYGMTLDYDWSEDQFDLLPRCSLKIFNAEVHTQSAIAAALELKHAHNMDPAAIENIDITTFLTAYHIVGGGEYGHRNKVYSKEQADHSMAYVVAVALLDNDLYPEQLTPERIKRSDVQDLIEKVTVHTGFPIHKPVKLAGLFDPFTAAYPEKLKCRITVTMESGEEFVCEKEDYRGYYTDPLTWDDVTDKFKRLTSYRIGNTEQIIQTINDLENTNVNQLLEQLFQP